MHQQPDSPKKMSPLQELRHSTAHVLATAVLRLFPNAKLDIGPPTDSGFYYDFDLDHKFTADDLTALESEMQKIINENQSFTRKEVSRQEASSFFQSLNQPYKLSRLDDIPDNEPISFYSNGNFTDLCAGTHVNSTKDIKAFKLLQISGAYYRGDEKNKQMQRIYGTAFHSKAELDAYLKQLEEAKNRDHRKIGKELGLFLIDNNVGQGVILWTPKGAIIRRELQNFISSHLRTQGYDEVFTPHIAKLDLFRISGHYPYYKDSQFPPVIHPDELQQISHKYKDIEHFDEAIHQGNIDGFLLKPMNCPMHIKIFDSLPRSYKELPVRLAEFGTVYRWEQSGELNGLTRVRGFTQDDAHIFCTEDQVAQEIVSCLNLVKIILETLGMHNYQVRLSLRDPDSSKYIGSKDLWDKAENALRQVVKQLHLPYFEAQGEAAFYGPKIDFLVKDVIDREWQLGTIQIDYNLPQRFNLSYTGADNASHTPVMIHRAPFGSMERFTGLLIEHFAGNFPTWLAPEQVRILPLSDDVLDYAHHVHDTLQNLHVRSSIDTHNDKLNAKIRRAETHKVPHILVLGKQEKEKHSVSLRSRNTKSLEGSLSLQDFTQRLLHEISQRHLPENFLEKA